MTFRDREKQRYSQIKTKLFSPQAQQHGTYKGIPRPFCLSNEYSYENLYAGIRDSAITYFLVRGIPWHDGQKGRHLPSNHLCCSQCCCVNFLFPLIKSPELSKAVFVHYYPQIAEMLPITEDKPLTDGSYPFIAFEWIGARDYLGESKRKTTRRTRGANFTSADFVVRFRDKDGQVHIVLGESKYTEAYGRTYKGRGHQGDTRKNNYLNFFYKRDGVFAGVDNKERLYGSLFYEPFYQFMRLQLLAQEMEGKEMDADRVSVLHVSPATNHELRGNVTSDYLKEAFPGKDVLQIWSELVPPEKFKSVCVEELLGSILQEAAADKGDWVQYLLTRYGWDCFGGNK